MNSCLKICLTLFSLSSLPVYAQQIIVQSPAGESYLFQVESKDSFGSVIDSIHKCIKEGALSKDTERATAATPYIMELLSTHEPLIIRMSNKPFSEPRNFAAGYSQVEAEDIAYIVKTLSNSSLPKIKSSESSLKKAGDRIDHVHPLQFLFCVFNNEEVKVAARNLVGRSWVWKEFLTGLTDTLAEENEKNNIQPFLNEFASALKVDVNILLSLQKSGKWDKFVTFLINSVPRDGNTDRYKQ